MLGHREAQKARTASVRNFFVTNSGLVLTYVTNMLIMMGR